MSLMGAISSTSCTQKWEMEKADVEGRVWQCQPTMCRILCDKLGIKDALVVSFTVNDMSDIIAHAFEPDFKVLTVPYDKIGDFKEPETEQPILYIGWYNSTPIRKFIEEGKIRKDAVILMMGKDKDFEFFCKERKTVDVWMNCEGDLGLLFVGCDRYHTVIHTPMDVPDMNIEFNKQVDNCVCGYKGATFKPTDKV